MTSDSGHPEPIKVRKLKEAADLLQTLGICKAFGPGGGVNGPNCYRFGHQDPSSRRWWWDVEELLEEARRRKSASEDTIQDICELYGLPKESAPRPVDGGELPERSRDQQERNFRDALLQLESVLLQRLRLDHELGTNRRADRRTLGKLISEAERTRLLSPAQSAEAYFVNATRTALYHSGASHVPDEDLARALNSCVALHRLLTRSSGGVTG